MAKRRRMLWTTVGTVLVASLAVGIGQATAAREVPRR